LDVARQWRELLPLFTHLGESVSTDRGLRIVELRLVSSALSYPHWEGDEPAVGLALIRIGFIKHHFNINQQIVALVGRHAFGRWYERRDGDDEALRDDLRALYLQRDYVLHIVTREDDQQFRASTAEGAWLGDVVVFDDATRARPATRCVCGRTRVPR
jgi:hypothetical protein